MWDRQATGTFIGCGADYGECAVALFGAPFDGTASYRQGARFAPAAVRSESYSIETYSPYQNIDLADVGSGAHDAGGKNNNGRACVGSGVRDAGGKNINGRACVGGGVHDTSMKNMNGRACVGGGVHDAGDLELPYGNTARALNMIENYTARVINDGKTPFMIGGEHLVTLGAARAAAKACPDMAIVQFDAHADLRDEFLGEELSHACVMRRCWDLLGDGRIYQFAVRSGERAEFAFAEEHTRMRRFGFNGLSEAIDSINLDMPGRPVYLTIDMDALDPSELPGTGTPEAGGARFNELLEAAIETIKKCNVIGLDITELCPPSDPGGISVPLACKLIRELLITILS